MNNEQINETINEELYEDYEDYLIWLYELFGVG